MRRSRATRAILRYGKLERWGRRLYLRHRRRGCWNDVERRVKYRQRPLARKRRSRHQKPAAFGKPGLREQTEPARARGRSWGGFEPLPMSNSLINGFPIAESAEAHPNFAADKAIAGP